MKEEIRVVIFLIVAACFFGYYKLLAKAEKKMPTTANATGTITRMNTSDSGNTWFYIQFRISDELCEGQTIKYINIPKDTKIGDQVNLSYYITPKGKCLCEVNEEGFVSVRDSGSKNYKKIYLVLSAVFLISSIAFAIKDLL